MAIEKKHFVDINLQGNKLGNATIGNNSDMTKAGAFRYNAETNHLEYFDGEVVRVITNSTELNALATSTNASIADLQTQINNVLSNTDGTALNSLAEIVAAFQQADNDLNGAITTLANAASANLDAEVARATAAEATLQSNIDAVASDLAAETAARISAVSTEAAARVAGDAALQSALDAEVAAREAALTAESAARTEAIATLQSDLNSGLDAEIARATAAEAALEDGKLSRDGSQAMTGSLDMANNSITNADSVQTNYLNTDNLGGNNTEINLISNIISNGSKTIKSLPNPTENGDAANKGYVDGKINDLSYVATIATGDWSLNQGGYYEAVIQHDLGNITYTAFYGGETVEFFSVNNGSYLVFKSNTLPTLDTVVTIFGKI